MFVEMQNKRKNQCKEVKARHFNQSAGISMGKELFSERKI